MAHAPDVLICEVGPRDGLQNLDVFVPTEAKCALIDTIAAAGSVYRTHFVMIYPVSRKPGRRSTRVPYPKVRIILRHPRLRISEAKGH